MPKAPSTYIVKTQWICVGICFFLSSYTGFSQSKTVVKGKITADVAIDFQVNIINPSNHSGTISGKDGTFEVSVNIGDALIFIAMGFENYELIVTDSVLDNAPIEIKLKEAVNFLDEVKISNNNLTGDLKKDAAKMDYFDQSEIGFPLSNKRKFTQVERRLYTASSTSVDYLINVLSGRMKMLKRMLEYEKLENKKEHIQNMFEEDFFVNELLIPKELIENFLYFCLDFLEKNAKVAAPFEMIEFLKHQAEEYRITMDLD